MRNDRSLHLCIYIKINEEVIVYLFLYIDDILMVISNTKENNNLKETLNREFEIKDLGETKNILGMDIITNHEKCELLLSQFSYLKRVMKLFRMLDAKNIYHFLDHHTKLLIMKCFRIKDEKKRW